MGSMSLMHWLVVLAIILVLFGAGKLPRVMGDFAKGIKAFKAGMKEQDEEEAAAAVAPPQVPPPTGSATPAAGPASANTAASTATSYGAVGSPPRDQRA
jgi:sec-independent protein translocase protein TatA